MIQRFHFLIWIWIWIRPRYSKIRKYDFTVFSYPEDTERVEHPDFSIQSIIWGGEPKIGTSAGRWLLEAC